MVPGESRPLVQSGLQSAVSDKLPASPRAVSETLRRDRRRCDRAADGRSSPAGAAALTRFEMSKSRSWSFLMRMLVRHSCTTRKTAVPTSSGKRPRSGDTSTSTRIPLRWVNPSMYRESADSNPNSSSSRGWQVRNRANLSQALVRQGDGFRHSRSRSRVEDIGRFADYGEVHREGGEKLRGSVVKALFSTPRATSWSPAQPVPPVTQLLPLPTSQTIPPPAELRKPAAHPPPWSSPLPAAM